MSLESKCPQNESPRAPQGSPGRGRHCAVDKGPPCGGPLQSHPWRSALLTAGHLAGPALTTPAASLALAMGRQDRLPTWLDRH